MLAPTALIATLRWRVRASALVPLAFLACADVEAEPELALREFGAISAEPSLLVLDEPVSSLDPEGRRDLLALIADLRDRATIIFSTHVLADVERICDRVGILDRGRLVTEGPLDDLLARYAQPLYRLDPEPGQAEAVGRLADHLRGLPWVDRVDEDGSGLTVSVTDADVASRQLLGGVVAEGVRLAAFERARPSLEDVFLRLVGAAD